MVKGQKVIIMVVYIIITDEIKNHYRKGWKYVRKVGLVEWALIFIPNSTTYEYMMIPGGCLNQISRRTYIRKVAKQKI